MNAATFAVLMVLGGSSPEASDPIALTAELGSPRFAQREAAEVALGRLGRAALPSLRAALSSHDPEIRTRASAIVRRIEGGLLVEPTLVDLDFDDVPLAEALATINRRSALKLTINPEVPALWAARRLSVRSGGPIPFWKAVDAICEAGQLHYVFGGQSDFEHGDSTFALYDGFASSRGMFHDQGPFRVQLASLHYQSEVHLSTEHPGAGRSGPGETAPNDPSKGRNLSSKQFFLQMLVGAEPRLSLAPAGPVKIIEAIDDRGRSLLIPNRGELVHHESGYLGVNPSPLVHLRVDLAYPDEPNARLKKIKGSIPLVVSTRRPDPLEIPLASAANKTFAQNNVKISVGEIRVGMPDQAATIELSIKVGDDLAKRAEDEDDEVGEIRSVASPQQLEVIDADGRMIPWFPSSSFFNGEEAKLTLTLLDRGVPVVPTSIRYHGVIRDQTEVAFEFRDLPMP